MNREIRCTLNGRSMVFSADPCATVLDVLRDVLHLLGTKEGCGTGDCGACTVLLEGRSVNSCLTLAVTVDGKAVRTVEGLAPSGEELHPIQEAFVQVGAIQCGFCTAGMEMSALHLLNHNPAPSEKEIREGLSGHLCRCTGYNQIVEAISVAAEKMRGNPVEEVKK